jgi:hypothetical protein
MERFFEELLDQKYLFAEFLAGFGLLARRHRPPERIRVRATPLLKGSSKPGACG